MSDTFKLFRLQQIDSQLDAIKNRLNEIELALSDQRELKLAESRHAAATESLDQVTAELRLAEGEVKAQRLKIEQTEATLYGGKVRNPKELQDLQNESAALKRYLAVLEDRQLEKMIAQEEAQADEAEASRRLEDERRHRESLHEA
jgi:predicted  nucleic acid-binding Zn-ribbon protein